MTTQRQDVNKERFYTDPSTAERLIKELKNLPWFRSATEFLEPSAGSGVWLPFLPPHTPLQAFDLEPKHHSVKEQDYLKLNLGYKRGRVAIGNPPFGRRGKLAKEFINKLAHECDYICFILPQSFVKPTLQSDINLRLHLIHEEVLGAENFSGPDAGGAVKCVFQVWEKRSYDRVKPVFALSHKDFEFVADPTDADFGVRTHGNSVGEIRTKLLGTESKTTWRFVKVLSKSVSNVVSVFSNLPIKDRALTMTTKQPCVGKRDLVELYSSVVP